MIQLAIDGPQPYYNLKNLQAYTSQIVVMAMMALAIGGDSISHQARREAIIDGLSDLPSKSCFTSFMTDLFIFRFKSYCGPTNVHVLYDPVSRLSNIFFLVLELAKNLA